MPAANLSSFTHVFRADVAANRPSRMIKAARKPVSCQSCRIRKLKCDREQPACGSCSKRGDGGSCSYSSSIPVPSSGGAVSSAARNGPSPGLKRAAPPRQEVQNRLQQLEQLVNRLLSQGPVTGLPAADSPPDSLSSTDNQMTIAHTGAASDGQDTSTGRTGGHIRCNGTEMPFVGATHWTAILESIHDIQGCLEETDGEHGTGLLPAEAQHEHLDILFGSVEHITIREVMAALPSRLRTDKLLGVYDKGRFTSTPVLHTQQFRRQYESFWLSPDSTSFLWISILFSTLAVAVLDEIPELGEEAAFAQQRFFTSKAMQCLVAGEYLKAKPYAVEALAMYALTRVSEKRDSDPYLWSIFGVAVRLAQRMGYHRDPSQITPVAGSKGGRGHITPFQAEMRRRSWFIIEAFDVMYSMQLGMPTIIQDDQCDVQPPRNLHDEDFDEDSEVLPPARPDTEPTKALYFKYKSMLIRHLRRIVLHVLSVQTHNYEETLTLNAELETIHDNIPPPLRLANVRGAAAISAGDSGMVAKSILHRIALELMYLKAVCILHRPYLTRRKTDPACELSRQACRQAAMRLLNLQSEMQVEIRPSGKLFEKGYLLGTLTLHDFLVAAMVLCLDLNETVGLSPETREAELLALRVAYSNLSSRRTMSKDAAHATKVLGAMLRKVSKTGAAGRASSPTLLPAQSLGKKRRQQPNREMPWINRDHVSSPAAVPADIPALSPRVPAVLPKFVREGNEALPYQNNGLLATMGSLDFSDVGGDPSDMNDQYDLGGILDNPDQIDWNTIDSYLLDRDSVMETAVDASPPTPQPTSHMPQPNVGRGTAWVPPVMASWQDL